MNQKHAERTVLNRHTSVQALGKTFGEVLNPSSLKNNLTNSVNSKCPGFSQSLLFKGVRFRKWMRFPHFSHHISTKQCQRPIFKKSHSLCPWSVTGEAMEPFYRAAHTSTYPLTTHPGKTDFKKQALSKGQSLLMLSPLSAPPSEILIIPTGCNPGHSQSKSGDIF